MPKNCNRQSNFSYSTKLHLPLYLLLWLTALKMMLTLSFIKLIITYQSAQIDSWPDIAPNS